MRNVVFTDESAKLSVYIQQSFIESQYDIRDEAGRISVYRRVMGTNGRTGISFSPSMLVNDQEIFLTVDLETYLEREDTFNKLIDRFKSHHKKDITIKVVDTIDAIEILE